MILADKYCRVVFRYTVLNLSGVRNNYSLISHNLQPRVGYFSHQLLQGGVNWIFLCPSVTSSLTKSGDMRNCNLAHILNPRGDLNSEVHKVNPLSEI